MRDLFRSVNDRVAELNGASDRDGSADAHHEYVCECGNRDCIESIELTLAQYRAVRAHPLRFVVAVDHIDPAEDRVLERISAAVVVEGAERMAPDRAPTAEMSR